jgi:hypothetical protein
VSQSNYGLADFFADARRILKDQGLPAGVHELRPYVERLLANPSLFRDHLGDSPPYGMHTIGHDPETDIYALAYLREKGRASAVHDHGPHWVIYGSYTNHTDMTVWRRLDDRTREGYAEVEKAREFKLTAGHAVAFLPGDIHSIQYPDQTRYLRVTGGDVESAKTLVFDPATKTVRVEDRALGQRP